MKTKNNLFGMTFGQMLSVISLSVLLAGGYIDLRGRVAALESQVNSDRLRVTEFKEEFKLYKEENKEQHNYIIEKLDKILNKFNTK